MLVRIICGEAYVLFDSPPSSGLSAELRRCGFTSRFGTIWLGTPDDLCRLPVPGCCCPPGHPALWPRDWSSEATWELEKAHETLKAELAHPFWRA